MSRATDSAGRVQPIVAPWNPSGYLFNAIDRAGVIVEAGHQAYRLRVFATERCMPRGGR